MKVSLMAGLLFCLAAMLAGPPRASAADAEYIGGSSGSFNAGAGGWTHDSQYGGLCLEALRGVTCPSVSGGYESSGGTGGAGDGHIRSSQSGTSLTALLSTSTSIWRSPVFNYNGAGGGTTPSGLRFSMEKRSAMANLLALGGEATYSVVATNQSGGKDVTLVETTSAGNNAQWSSVPATRLGRNAFAIGDAYRFVIKTTIGGLAAVLPSGHIDFDDVRLTASSDGTDGPGGTGAGGPGTNGGPGSEIAPPAVIPAGVAYLYKNRLYIRAKCPKRFKPACRIKAVALTKKKRGKKMTKFVRTAVRTLKFKRKALQVKPKFRTKVRKLSKIRRKTLVVKLNIRSKKGKKKGVAFHKLRVIHRVKK